MLRLWYIFLSYLWVLFWIFWSLIARNRRLRNIIYVKYPFFCQCSLRWYKFSNWLDSLLVEVFSRSIRVYFKVKYHVWLFLQVCKLLLFSRWFNCWFNLDCLALMHPLERLVNNWTRGIWFNMVVTLSEVFKLVRFIMFTIAVFFPIFCVICIDF